MLVVLSPYMVHTLVTVVTFFFMLKFEGIKPIVRASLWILYSLLDGIFVRMS